MAEFINTYPICFRVKRRHVIWLRTPKFCGGGEWWHKSYKKNMPISHWAKRAKKVLWSHPFRIKPKYGFHLICRRHYQIRLLVSFVFFPPIFAIAKITPDKTLDLACSNYNMIDAKSHHHLSQTWNFWSLRLIFICINRIFSIVWTQMPCFNIVLDSMHKLNPSHNQTIQWETRGNLYRWR